jgi:hypothetical protein
MKAPVFGQAWEQLPKPLVCPTHHVLAGNIGIINIHQFLGAGKYTKYQEICDISR